MSTSRRSFLARTAASASAGLLLPKLSAAMADPKCACVQNSLSDPDIRVLLSGLFLYRFADKDEYCDINPLRGVDKLRGADKHVFSVIVKARYGNGAPYTIWRYFDKPKQLTLSLDGAASKVQKYPRNGDFDRNAENNDCMDWRWILRLEEFEKPKPKFKDDKLWPGLRVHNGLFYTAIKTDPDQTAIACECKSGPKTLCSVGSVVGINISFDDQHPKASLKGVSEEPVEMTRGLKYEIYIDYDPRKPIAPTRFTQDGRTKYTYKTHFHKYFEAMKDAKEMCDVTYSRERATPDVPCMGLEG
jgi:hypothetical protein